MIIDRVIGSGLEKEFVQFMKLQLNLDDETVELFIDKIRRGEFSIENPEELKRIESQFKQFILTKFELDLDGSVDPENIKNARNLAIETDSKIPSVLSVLITVGFFSVLGFMLFNESKPNDTLLIMLGSLGTAWIAVVNYWFGSSSGSAYKNVLIERISKR
jgi:hypothetical protein